MPKPRVVPAGEPTRMPLVFVGGRGSPGTPFLLQVMAERSSASSASFPVTPSGRRSTRARCVSVPPVTMSAPRSFILPSSALAFAFSPFSFFFFLYIFFFFFFFSFLFFLFFSLFFFLFFFFFF